MSTEPGQDPWADSRAKAVHALALVLHPSNIACDEGYGIKELAKAMRQCGFQGSLDPKADALIRDLKTWRESGGCAPAYIWKRLEECDAR